MTRTGVVDSVSVVRAVIVIDLPRTAVVTEVVSLKASASTQTDWLARCSPFVARTTIR